MVQRWVTAGLIVATIGADLAVMHDRDTSSPDPVTVSGKAVAAYYEGASLEIQKAAASFVPDATLEDPEARWLLAKVSWKAELDDDCSLDLLMHHPKGWTWESSVGALPADLGSDDRTFALTADKGASSAAVLFRVPVTETAKVSSMTTTLVARCDDSTVGEATVATGADKVNRIPKPLPDPGEAHERGETHVLNTKGQGTQPLKITGISGASTHVIIRWVCDGPGNLKILDGETHKELIRSECAEPIIDLYDVATPPLPSTYIVEAADETSWRIAFSVRH